MPPTTRSSRKVSDPTASTSTSSTTAPSTSTENANGQTKTGEKRSRTGDDKKDKNITDSTSATNRKGDKNENANGNEKDGSKDGEQDDLNEPKAKKQKTLEEFGVVTDSTNNSGGEKDTKGDEKKEQDEQVEKEGKENDDMEGIEVLDTAPAVFTESTDEEKNATKEDRAEAEEKAVQAAESDAGIKAEGADPTSKAGLDTSVSKDNDDQKAPTEQKTETETETDTLAQDDKKDHGPKKDKDDTDDVGSDPVPEAQTEAEKDLVKHEDVKEYGQIFFAFKPRVATPHPKSIHDVQRLHIILQPHAQSDPSGKPVLSRLIQIAKKVLPGSGSPTGGNGGRGESFWGYVSEVSENVADLHGRMEETKQETKTMGTRVTPADRIIATGPYALISQSSSKDPGNPRRSTHLIYTLTAPSEMGEVQKAFNLSKEGSFGMSVKNPKQGSPRGTGLSEPAKFSDELQDKMSTLRWHAVDPPQYLDYVNAEFIFTANNPHSMSETLEKSSEDHADENDHEGEDIAEDLRQIVEAEADGHHMHENGKGAGEGVVDWVVDMLKARDTVDGGAETLIKGHWE